MAHQLKAAAPTRRRKLALWNKDNKEQWGIVKLIPKYADVLRKNCPDLCEIIQHEDLWRFLKKYGVTDRVIEDRIKAHDTSEDVVYHLLHHIECGPAWRLHALLRACCKRHQEHVVTLLGLDPDVYSGPSPPESDNEESSPPLTDMCFHCPTSVVQVTSETTTLSPSPPGQQSRTLSPCQEDVGLQHLTSEVQGTEVQASGGSFGLMRHEVLPPLQHVGKERPAVQGSISFPPSAKLTHDPSLSVSDVSTDAPRDSQKVTDHRASPLPSTRGIINLGSASMEKQKAVPSPSTATDLLLSVPEEKSTNKTTSSHRRDVCTQKRFLSSEAPAKMDDVISTEAASAGADITSGDKDHLEIIIQRLWGSRTASSEIDELLELIDDTDLQSIDVLKTVERVYLNSKTAGKGVSIEEQQRFYHLCLYGLLGNMKEFTEEHLKKFNLLGSAYLSFFKKLSKKRYPRDVTCYYLENTTLCDFFASRALESLPDVMTKSLLLDIISKNTLRNCKDILFRLLGKCSSKKSIPLLVGMTQLILLQVSVNTESQNKSTSNIEWNTFVSHLQTLQQRLHQGRGNPRLFLEPDNQHPLDTDAVIELWGLVTTTFGLLTGLTTKNQSPFGENYWGHKYFNLPGHNKPGGFVTQTILNLLTDCYPDVQTAVAKDTYCRMLPCHRFYLCGNIQWVNVEHEHIDCWSPEDVAAGLLQYIKTFTYRETVDQLELDISSVVSQWRRAPDDPCWTRAAWDTALHAVVSDYTMTRLVIRLPTVYSPPLQGLLYSITHLDTSHYPRGGIRIHDGTISLSELHQWYQEAGTTHNMNITLWYTHLQLPADTHTREQQLQWVGEEFLQDVRQHITDEGLTKGVILGVYPLTGDISLGSPDITFM